jgi:23S rRNA (uracil1939-C5)-methyltransferase
MRARPFTIETSVGELSPGGDGVAICTIDGERRAVFVPGVVPGERVRVEVDPSRRPARGRLLTVLDASASRVAPPCEHVERCGGCDWMHLAPSEQAAEHARIVGRLLGFEPKSHPGTQLRGYRTRARVHIEAKRGRVVVGMFGRRSHEPAPVDTCIVLDPILDRARGALATWLQGAQGRGEAQLSLGRPGEIRLPVLDLRWTGELGGAFFGRTERAVVAGELAGARIFEGDVRVPAKIGDPTPYIVGADGEPLRLAPGGFSQATERGNELLAGRVAELVRELPAGPCVELYAGAGNLTVLLARERSVVAVEQDRDACAAARENLAARSATGSGSATLDARVVEADAAAFPIPKGTRVVVLDPPREGARAVAEALAARGARANAPSIVYVACDPPTLARDVRILVEAGWELRAVETFEMFPQTSHVETVAVLVPRGTVP